MASYAKKPQVLASANDKMSILAQAKPAIISASSNDYTPIPMGALSEQMNKTLRFASSRANAQLKEDTARLPNNYEQKFSNNHIEDDNVILKQNASNQMRQAAVMAAVASQHKVRLSATERLALTAKRPMTNQQIQPQPTDQSRFQQQQQQQNPTIGKTCTNNNAPSVAASKPTPMPTLETLLAVQRQLQQHTKQNLTPAVPQHQVVNYDRRQESVAAEHTVVSSSSQQRNKPLPPSPPMSPAETTKTQQQQKVDQITQPVVVDTYDKDLPPLPPSISPTTSTDDSQLNSLDSQQDSSPATSLVSIPPPPPPISSYLEQYDEVSSCHQSNSSSPSTVTSSSGVSSIKPYSPLQVKSSMLSQHNQFSSSFDLPLPCNKQSLSFEQNTYKLPSLAPVPVPKPLNNPPIVQHHNPNLKHQAQLSAYQYHLQNLSSQQNSNQNGSTNLSSQYKTPTQVKAAPVKQPVNCPPTANTNQIDMRQSDMNYNQHVFAPPKPSFPSSSALESSACHQSVTALPPPPPVPESKTYGFDEADCGSFRFPTPPPPDLLLDGQDEVDFVEPDEEYDDDFQCKIPAPSANKSMSAASFQDFNCHNNLSNNQKHSQSAIFNSSTFSAQNTTSNMHPPPPLFRQQQHQQVAQTPNSALIQPQLTVHINNEGGLLSTALTNHRAVNNEPHNHHHHHHHIMMTMTSSSSPSSSSDGDGQSSNSSSSTSGIHSSIDSPSSSNSKLDDFNYSGAKIKKLIAKQVLAANHEVARCGSNKNNENVQKVAATSTKPLNTKPRPALKQKKTVSFSDKVELVACAEEHCEDHLPNPLLARVLAGKMQ